MRPSLALAPFFWKGVAVTVSSVVLFVGSVYVLLSAYFGLRMGYLVLATSFFAWMLLLSALWAFGTPGLGTLPNLGPRGIEPHWQVFAAGTDDFRSKYPETAAFPHRPWDPPDANSRGAVDSAKTIMQEYLAERANEELKGEVDFGAEKFTMTDFKFARTEDGTHLVGARGFFINGGAEVVVFAYHDSGNVPIYSWGFLLASLVGLLVHLPFLDRAEQKRKDILTGGEAPPWFGPA